MLLLILHFLQENAKIVQKVICSTSTLRADRSDLKMCES